jgi:hypothetical protein
MITVNKTVGVCAVVVALMAIGVIIANKFNRHMSTKAFANDAGISYEEAKKVFKDLDEIVKQMKKDKATAEEIVDACNSFLNRIYEEIKA